YGTPAFVFDVDMLQTRLQSIKEIVGEKIHLCYAIKANPFLIEANLTQVDNLEVCSPGELAICKKLHVDMSTVILSGVNKTPEDIADALDHHVGLYTAESQLHVDLLNAAGKSRNQVLPVLLRLTSGSQFGMDESVLRNVIANRGDYPFLSIEGIHYFVGTQRHKIAEQQKELVELQLFANLYRAIITSKSKNWSMDRDWQYRILHAIILRILYIR
ncbi:MAG: alanine racemase, partial [Ruthenibacterium sp.]